MKNFVLTFLGLFAFAVLLVNCTGASTVKEEAQEAVAEGTEAMGDAVEGAKDVAEGAMDAAANLAEEVKTGVMISTDAYSTSVLEAGIPSPRKEMTGSIDGVAVTVNYGSPAQKGRTLWGDLIASDRTWRTGANKATVLTVDKNVTVGGIPLKKGSYSVFSIQTADQATMIINSNVEARESDYDEAKDALRLSIPSTTSTDSSESLEFMIEGNNLVMAWGTRRVAMPIAKG